LEDTDNLPAPEVIAAEIVEDLQAALDQFSEIATTLSAGSTTHAASLKAAIAQLKDLAELNANRSSQEALVANLVLLRAHGVDDEVLDLVVEMVLAQNVDEEMTAAVNYLAAGFLLALLTLKEERVSCG
jgi:hypothetical protein